MFLNKRIFVKKTTKNGIYTEGSLKAYSMHKFTESFMPNAVSNRSENRCSWQNEGEFSR